jgi:very-short-patch-repair endonuclease
MHNNNLYNKNLREFARELRTQSVSKAEKPIFNFIVDFFAPELGLIIEIDGSSHKNKAEYDFYRQQKLESFGYVFLRFKEGDVIQNIPMVKESIDYAIFCLKKENR